MACNLIERPLYGSGTFSTMERVHRFEVRHLEGDVDARDVRIDVLDAQVHMVDQSSSMQFHDGLLGLSSRVLHRIVDS